MRLIKTIYLYVIVFGFLCHLNAQEFNAIENVTFDTKLQNHNITSIEQDGNGFLWIGTNFGLYRYDGYHFISYNIYTKPSLSNNNIRTLKIVDNELWVGTKGGITIINTNTKNAINYKKDTVNPQSIANNYVTKIFKGNQNSLWIGYATNKFSKYLGNHKFQNFKINNVSKLCQVNDIIEVSEDNLILDIIDGNPQVKKIISIQIIGNQTIQKEIYTEDVNSTVIFKSGSNIYSLLKSKLYVYDAATKNFKYHSTFDKNISSYSGLALSDNLSNIFIGTNLSSFYNFNLNDKNTISETFVGKDNTLVNVFFIDKTGLLWVATTDGLYKLKKKHLLFDHYLYKKNGLHTVKMRSIIQDFSGSIYAVGNDSLYHYNPIKKQFENKKWINKIKTTPYALLAYDENNFLVGTQGNGLGIYNKKTNIYDSFYQANKLLPPNTHVLKIYKDLTNVLWLGTANGLYYFNKATDKMYVVLGDENGISYLKNDIIYDIVPFKNDQLWIGSSSGLYHIQINYNVNPISVKVSKIQNILHEIRSILTVKNTLWLATQSNGVFKYKIDTKEIDKITEEDGLVNNTVYSVLPGAKNELWFGTLKGLSRYDTVNKQILNFFEYDGLAGNEFNTSSQLKTKNGILFFGGQNGISSIDPKTIEIKKTNFKLNITNISWYNSDKDSTYFANIDNNNLTTLELPNSNAFVNFEFSLSDYFKPQNNTFKYRLIGLHDDWRMFNKTNILSYTNLPPGDYTLEVMAATNYCLWNEQIISLPIIVNQIFYKKWWFLMSLAVLLLLFLFLFRKYELYHLKELEKLRFRISRDLHDELGSTLTGIAIRSEIIKEKLDSKEKDDFLSDIAKQSREAVDTLSDVVWAIDSRNNALVNLTDRMQDVLFLLLSPLNITFSFKTVDSQNSIYLNQDYRRHVFLIFKEAITNIIKHSNATHVNVTIKKDKYFLILTIHDNGTKVIESNVTLNGNGIKNMKSRAEKIKGILNFSKKKGFTVELMFDYLY
ncbi:hypothetical protein EC396_03620 [Lutibacter sp. HS1-25]|uniref:ligand-binding sensor domain-containing protein n=1 Tax=Lutibacter sp. HS1-25 TaxID=2485000 RepID=UPI001011109A|nr:sensor histidine kinase [Lutibacter sp. HS1-25]RXP61908.1 hypothetical protein EC396_03620 [Lutibacter sp. HS1-25]